MAGLACAHELSRTERLRETYDITVYQMGWRLGGKAASGRDPDGRNLEHGLHVWFGYYENAFRLLREAYEARGPDPDSPLQSCGDAFKPQNHTAIGVDMGAAAGWTHVPVNWPQKHGAKPGDGKPVDTLWEALVLLVGLVEGLLAHPAAPRHARSIGYDAFDRRLYREALAFGRPGDDPRPGGHLADAQAISPLHALAVAGHWLAALTHQLGGALDDHLRALGELIAAVERIERRAGGPASNHPVERLIAETIHIFCAAFRGAVSDLLRHDRPFEAIDDLDFRAWLIKHHADREIVARSSIVRLVYDISFQYTDGNIDRPDCAAGSALGTIVRMLTYKEAMMYVAQAGFGETVVSPIYSAVVKAGVRFQFFRKVVGLDLTGDRQGIAQVRLHRQADIRPGADYAPTIKVGGLTCWPSQPSWDQLVEGERLRAAGADFESRWCAEPPAGEETLTQGADFDHVVLAIAMGAYKPLTDPSSGEHDPGFCRALAEANADFARFLTMPLSPTMALQVWSDRSLEDLGGPGGPRATVSGPQPLNIWADMSSVLATEGGGAASLHYFCGAYATTLYAASPARADVPALADEEVKAIAKDWLRRGGPALWPGAVVGGEFDWTMLADRSDRAGEARFEAQFWRANIDPTECCVASAAGTTAHRLFPWQSGFANLTLAGEATRHGVNATAVEAAVMSGFAAAFSIRGESRDVPGFDFLTRRPWSGPWRLP
jgi:uncharacterized protein with NAD-binding domain and iron-sulfur cluster